MVERTFPCCLSKWSKNVRKNFVGKEADDIQGYLKIFGEYRFQLGPINSKQEMMSPVLHVACKVSHDSFNEYVG